MTPTRRPAVDGATASARGFDRTRHRVICVPADDSDSAHAALERARQKDAFLVVNRRDRLGRYVISTGSRGKPLLLLSPTVNDDLDYETAGRAVWVAHYWSLPRRDGKIAVTLQRVSPRHGRPSTYQHHGCRCDECTLANTLQQRAYRARTALPKVRLPLTHGAQCSKRGCHCEAGRAAARERQQRSRANRRRRAAAAATQPSSNAS